MQVKRRINKFLESIRRKDKTEEDIEEDVSARGSSKKKNKWKARKNSQNYSQWDLMQNIADPIAEDEVNNTLNKGIVVLSEESETKNNSDWDDIENLVELVANEENSVENVNKKRKSFLQRSGSFLRRSIRRSKKSSGESKKIHDPMNDDESLQNVVREMNRTIAEVATFGGSTSWMNENKLATGDINVQLSPALDESYNTTIVEVHLLDTDAREYELTTGEEVKVEKFTLKKGLQRKVSQLVSKFERNSGSLRLKSSSIDSFPGKEVSQRGRSASLDEGITKPEPDTLEASEHSKTLKKSESLKRKMSFKKARKAVRKGVTTLGKNMVHASAVMPTTYECPPATLYPDYEANYPSELEQYYYRTISYQPKEWNDKMNLQYSRRPASYYQHGFCYNG